MDNDFQIGDVVALKSYGPKMTVTGIDAEKRLYCAWFVKGKVFRDTFKAITLNKSTDQGTATGVPQIQPGDVVKLKSGGPPMTVAGVSDNDGVFCLWFEDKDSEKANRDGFKVEALEKTTPKSGGLAVAGAV